MKRMITRMALIASMAGLLLVVFASRDGRSRVVPTAHAQEGCSVASVKGAYGFFRTGMVPVGPLAAVGIAMFDGSGTASARQTIRKNGVTTSDLFTDPPLVGPYEVDSDCAGRMLTDAVTRTVFAHFVVVDGGKELFIISLTDANTVYGVMKKIRSEQD
jgi:hypothetical protein